MPRRFVLPTAALLLAGAALGAAPAGVDAPKAEGRPDVLHLTVSGSESGAYNGSRTLRCRPTGGDHPHPRAACAKLREATADGGDPFAPVGKGELCTLVHGGDATAKVRGTWRGARVDARFDRTDGCEIDRWSALVPVLPRS
ncbi:SSI family serine proteinase inhibitor [Streptomyces xiaopingdaonensis]|uniref:SSI family serine proteinase inhibitor n=1 Tax=Streptomyces xiaopingdaonensis TaxID=1565415 RepID=UPI0002F117D8|nr:SSI family serine proteinase inhibitor [Streptomyces xiaopingdaonensis]